MICLRIQQSQCEIEQPERCEGTQVRAVSSKVRKGSTARRREASTVSETVDEVRQKVMVFGNLEITSNLAESSVS